jgi:hypothetical protein
MYNYCNFYLIQLVRQYFQNRKRSGRLQLTRTSTARFLVHPSAVVKLGIPGYPDKSFFCRDNDRARATGLAGFNRIQILHGIMTGHRSAG